MSKRPKILLVEDNPSDIRLTIEAFNIVGFDAEMVSVMDGQKAIDILKGQGGYMEPLHPDIILLDLNLPRKNGREVLTEVKSCEFLRSIPVLVLSTSGSERDILETNQLHASSFISKPVDFEDFFNVVKRIQDFWLDIIKQPVY